MTTSLRSAPDYAHFRPDDDATEVVRPDGKRPWLVEPTASGAFPDLDAMGIQFEALAQTLAGPQAVVFGDESIRARLGAEGYRVSPAPPGYYLDERDDGIWVHPDHSITRHSRE